MADSCSRMLPYLPVNLSPINSDYYLLFLLTKYFTHFDLCSLRNVYWFPFDFLSAIEKICVCVFHVLPDQRLFETNTCKIVVYTFFCMPMINNEFLSLQNVNFSSFLSLLPQSNVVWVHFLFDSFDISFSVPNHILDISHSRMFCSSRTFPPFRSFPLLSTFRHRKFLLKHFKYRKERPGKDPRSPAKFTLQPDRTVQNTLEF